MKKIMSIMILTAVLAGVSGASTDWQNSANRHTLSNSKISVRTYKVIQLC